MMTRRRDWALSAAVGALFGVLIRLGDSASGAVAWVVNISGPWLLLAFVVGALSPDGRSAVARSALTLETAVVAKYALQLAQGDIAATQLAVRLVVWGVAALLVSAVLAPLGRRARSQPSPLSLLAAALAVEALAFLTGVLHGESAHLRYRGQSGATAVFGVELGVAGACLALATARLRHARSS